MIGVPAELAPSSLLYEEQVPRVVQLLLNASRTSRLRQEWKQSEQYALDALVLCRETGIHVGLALVRIYLADFYGDVGELGQALEQCEEAYQVLQRQPVRAQRHNAALAAYGLGILNGLRLSGNVRALNWYQKAIEWLEGAQEYWATINATSQIKICRRVRQEIDRRRELTIARSRTGQHLQEAVFTIWQLDSESTPFPKPNGPQGYVIGDGRVLIDGIPYQPRPAINTDETNYCFALPVPQSRWTVPGARPGDYVFVRHQWQIDEEKMGVVWERGNGWVAVGFKRRPDDRIDFFHFQKEIIGGLKPPPGDPSGKMKGTITAILKREQ